MESEVYFSPRGKTLERIRAEIDKAKRSIDLAMYTLSSNYLIRALIQAHERGVFLRIVMDHKEAKKNFALTSQLLQIDIPTRFLSPRRGLFHHKFTLVDGQTLIAGSGNYTSSMEYRNYDATLFVYDPPLIEKFLAEFENLWSEATPVLDGRMKLKPDYHKHLVSSGRSYWHPVSYDHTREKRGRG